MVLLVARGVDVPGVWVAGAGWMRVGVVALLVRLSVVAEVVGAAEVARWTGRLVGGSRWLGCPACQGVFGGWCLCGVRGRRWRFFVCAPLWWIALGRVGGEVRLGRWWW